LIDIIFLSVRMISVVYISLFIILITAEFSIAIAEKNIRNLRLINKHWIPAGVYPRENGGGNDIKKQE